MNGLSHGFFISFEGTEGTGKTTQVRRLAAALRALGHDVCETREPGGTVLGEQLRGLVKHQYQGPPACATAELLLMCASRAQLVHEVIQPALKRREIVICDRFADSTTVYQGYGRGLDKNFIGYLHEQTVDGCRPDLTILLQLDLNAGLSRAALRAQRGKVLSNDRFEAEDRVFHEKIQDGFAELAGQEPGRIRTVSAEGTEESVHQRIMEIVNHALGT